MPETLLSPSSVLLFGRQIQDIQIVARPDARHGSPAIPRGGSIGEVEQQLVLADARFARIYGFSFEGAYYDLPRPMLYLVHGDGAPVTEAGPQIPQPPAAAAAAPPVPNRARSVPDPDLGGVGAADFQFADDMRVWSYDKADYTIRMDVDTGMFEEILLDAILGAQDGLDARGMNARGMNARGMNARGMNARGMNARGMNARGMNARGGSSD